MNAISRLTGTSGLTQIYTNAAVQAVRPVTSNAQRASLAQVDRFEPSSSRPVTPTLTYGRNGQGGGADSDGDGD